MLTLLMFCEGDIAAIKRFDDLRTMCCWRDGFAEGALNYGAGSIESYHKSGDNWCDAEGLVVKDDDKIKELNDLIKK